MANYIQITTDTFETMLDRQFKYAQEHWGNYKTEAMWPIVKDMMIDAADCRKPEHNDPSYLVDNYVINAEIISRDEFEDPDFYISDRDEYEDFAGYAEAHGLLWTDDYVLVHFGS